MVRRVLVPLASSFVIAVSIFAMPASALAESWAPFYGPVLNCTGYFQIEQEIKTPDAQNSANATTSVFKYQAVDNDATNGLPPCRSICDVFVLINNLLKFAVTLIITVFIPAMFIIGGFYIMTGGGNPGRRATGQKVITGTLIGLALTIGATLIVNQMMNILFERAWGDALHQALVDQATETGADPASIPSFQWDTISCRAMEGGIEIKTSTSTSNPLVTTPPPRTPPVQAQAQAGTCYPAADAAKLSCQQGWINAPAGYCPQATPRFCRGLIQAQTNKCYTAADKAGYACSTQWSTCQDRSLVGSHPYACE